MKLIGQLKTYDPFNEQEEKDKALLLHCLETEKDVFLRGNSLCHFTASAWVTDPPRKKILMAYHRIYDSWSWLGGHADGEEDLLQVALREVQEESGLTNVRPLLKDIFSVESLTVDGHMKKGEYVSSHIHLNVTYLLEADDTQTLTVKEDENSGVRWFSREEAVSASNEKWFRDNIYSKLNAKLAMLESEGRL